MAKKHGLDVFVRDTIMANSQGRCEATEKEVNMLARLCDDERISRADIPKLLGKSYRQSNDDNDFEKIKKLRHVGIYSKVSALLLIHKSKDVKKQNGNR